MFETLKKKWVMKYITIETLQGWVEVEAKKPGKGITQEQYEEIIATPQGAGTGDGAMLAMKVAAYEEALTELGVLPLEE